MSIPSACALAERRSKDVASLLALSQGAVGPFRLTMAKRIACQEDVIMSL